LGGCEMTVGGWWRLLSHSYSRQTTATGTAVPYKVVPRPISSWFGRRMSLLL
jgi:hypothetical protein